MSKIVKYVSETYFKYFKLYRYCLYDKGKNEEIKIHVFVDKPQQIPPLKEALYMGTHKLEAAEDDDDEDDEKN